MRILLVDDESEIVTALEDLFFSFGHEVRCADSAEKALAMMSDWIPEVLLTDVRMRGMSGLDLLTKVQRSFPLVTPVVMTAQGSIDAAITAIRRGAFDYLVKPFSVDQLEHLLEKIADFRRLREENAQLRDQLDLLTLPSTLTTRNSKMRRLLETASKVAPTDASILLTGESGTGKTHLAKLIHEGSLRHEGPFAVVNCATFSEHLLESELFGHVRGSFTGAVRDKVGRLQTAESGTVFLDEIGEISLNLQTKLLRFLQDREFERVGDSKTIRVDVRIIAATNKDLEKAVLEGKFREDLYFRLNVIELQLPSLRERPEDLEGLIESLLPQAFARLGREPKELSPEAEKAVFDYGWPGNIRELKHALERAAILCAGEWIELEDLPERVSGLEDVAFREDHCTSSGYSLVELERIHIQRVLAASQTLEDAASVLGIDLSTLWRKRKQYGMDEKGNLLSSGPSSPDPITESYIN